MKNRHQSWHFCLCAIFLMLFDCYHCNFLFFSLLTLANFPKISMGTDRKRLLCRRNSYNSFCFDVIQAKSPFNVDEAEYYCRYHSGSGPGTLAQVRNEQQMQSLVEVLENNAIDKALISLRRTETSWQWIVGPEKEPLWYQGEVVLENLCYTYIRKLPSYRQCIEFCKTASMENQFSFYTKVCLTTHLLVFLNQLKCWV